jgi:uncharacterized protein (DUF2252 family)
VIARDPVAEIISYNQPLLQHRVESSLGDLTSAALRRKLEALAASPFQFFRGTFHLMAWDLFKNRVPLASAAAPEGLIVGDLHLENFGIYRGASGDLVFDVNDFDDVGRGPLDLDLKRLCTSAMLLPGLAHGVRLNAARAIARGWAEELVKNPGRFPIPPWDEKKAEGLVQSLLGERRTRTRAEVMEKVAPDKGRAKLVQNEKYVRPSKEWVATVQASFAEYVEALKQLKAPDAPKGWNVLDMAYRFKGTGSLGRLRFSLLLGQGSDRRMVEIKEARSSAMDDARGCPESHQRARVQTASIRRLQADPWPRVAGTHLGKYEALGRENEPEEEKVGCERFSAGDAKHEELSAYARQCGQVIARMHARQNAPAILAASWDVEKAAKGAVEFAEKYAPLVESDQKALVAARGQVAMALKLI